MQQGYQRVRMPRDLDQADAILQAYGRWAQDRWIKRHCASAEGRYAIPDNWGGEGAPEPLIPTFLAMDVHRALLMVALRYRRVLYAHYIPQRLPADAQRRAMHIPMRVWDADLIAGVRMFWNCWSAYYAGISAQHRLLGMR